METDHGRRSSQPHGVTKGVGGRSGLYTPWWLVRFAAAEFTPQELCGMHETAQKRGEHHNARLYLEALSIHACRTGWGDLIEQSMNGWKEVDVGLVQGGRSAPLPPKGP